MSVAPILPGDDAASIARAAKALRAGGLVGMPTETVYGLAANALDPAAVAKVFEAKQRPSFDPLIVHVASPEHATDLAVFDTISIKLAKAFWPGPLTLVLPRLNGPDGRPIVPDLVTSGLDSVGIRVPEHPLAQRLLEACDTPLAAPSANRFGSISPTTAQHVLDELGGRIDLILDGGPCARGVESTVVNVDRDAPRILRLGAVDAEAIERVVGTRVEVSVSTSSPGAAGQPQAFASPGMTDRHYAPATPMRLVDSPDALARLDMPGRLGLVMFGPAPIDTAPFACTRNLSEQGRLAEAAANLFATLRELDAERLDAIVAIPVPDEGLGRAINDRLKRGSAR